MDHSKCLITINPDLARQQKAGQSPGQIVLQLFTENSLPHARAACWLLTSRVTSDPVHHQIHEQQQQQQQQQSGSCLSSGYEAVEGVETTRTGYIRGEAGQDPENVASNRH